MHCCQLGSTSFQAVKIEKCLKRNYVIKVVSMKNTGNFLLHEGSYKVQPQHQNFLLQMEHKGGRMHCMYVLWYVKGTS